MKATNMQARNNITPDKRGCCCSPRLLAMEHALKVERKRLVIEFAHNGEVGQVLLIVFGLAIQLYILAHEANHGKNLAVPTAAAV